MPYLVLVIDTFKMYLNNAKGGNYNAEIYKILDYPLRV